MKQVNQFLAETINQDSQMPSECGTTSDQGYDSRILSQVKNRFQVNAQVPEQWIDKLFGRLAAKYGHKWNSAFPNDDALAVAKYEWRKELARVNPQMIDVAMTRLSKSFPSWPPTPMEFASLCQIDAEAMGLPSAETAWVIVCNATRHAGMKQRWNHPVIFHAARDGRLDLYNMRMESTEKAMTVWGPVYADYVRRFANGEKFEFQVEKALENQVGKSVTPGEKKRSKDIAMAALRSMRRGLKQDLSAWHMVHGMKVFA